MSSGPSPESSQTVKRPERYLPPVLAVAVAIATRMPAVETWWCLDDWGLLARAEGLTIGAAEYPARWISQDLWWRIVVPLFGLEPVSHAVLRIALLALGAVAVTRIAGKHGVSPFARGLAGILFATTPIAFTPVFWASAVQELLAVVFLLLAYDNWLGTNRRAVCIATVFGVVSILAKEPGLGLPLVLVAIPGLRPGRRPNPGLRRIAIGVLLAVAVVESVLLLRQFDTRPGAPYEIAGMKTILGNIGTFGWWLVTLGSRFTGQMDWGRAGVGMGVMLAWLLLGCIRRRRGHGQVLTLFVIAMTTLLPALPLLNQARPYMALGAAAFFYVAVAEVLQRRPGRQVVWLVPLAALAAVLGHAAMRERMTPEELAGAAVDPVVRAAHLSRDACEFIRSDLETAPLTAVGAIVFYQQPLRSRDRRDADLVKTPLYGALGGGLGPALIAGRDRPVDWTTSIETVGGTGRVYCETRVGLESWGDPWTAKVNAALLFILVGNFERAADCMSAATKEGRTSAEYRYDRDLLRLPIGPFFGRAEEFRLHLQRATAAGLIPEGTAETLARQTTMLVKKVLEAGAPPPTRTPTAADPDHRG